MIPTYSILPGGGSGGTPRESSFQFIKDANGNGAIIFDITTGKSTRIDDIGGDVGIKQIEKTSSGVYAIKNDGTRVLLRPLEQYEQDEFNAAASSATSKAASDAVSAKYAEPTAAANLENMNLNLAANRMKLDEERRSRVVNEMIAEGKINPSQGFALLGKFAEFDALENSKQTAFENTRARRMEERAAGAKEVRDYQGGIDLSMNYFGGGNPQYRQQYAQFLNNLPGKEGESQATRMYRSVSGIQGPLPTAYVDPGQYTRAEFAPPNVDLNAEIARRYPAPVAALPTE
jgi:polyhydroxyalkanoate synthesis regulator phasin